MSINAKITKTNVDLTYAFMENAAYATLYFSYTVTCAVQEVTHCQAASEPACQQERAPQAATAPARHTSRCMRVLTVDACRPQK